MGMNMRHLRYRVAVVIYAAALLHGSAAAAESGWQLLHRGAAGSAFVADGRGSLAVSCESEPQPTVTIAYTAPRGVRLAERVEGVWTWNIAFAGSTAASGDEGALYLFDETEQGGRWIYRMAADASSRQGSMPIGQLEDVMMLLSLLQRAARIEVSSVEGDAAGLRPVFRHALSLAGSRKAIDEAMAAGGCAAMLADAWADFESGL
jgi:hypothetical protein